MILSIDSHDGFSASIMFRKDYYLLLCVFDCRIIYLKRILV